MTLHGKAYRLTVFVGEDPFLTELDDLIDEVEVYRYVGRGQENTR